MNSEAEALYCCGWL